MTDNLIPLLENNLVIKFLNFALLFFTFIFDFLILFFKGIGTHYSDEH